MTSSKSSTGSIPRIRTVRPDPKAWGLLVGLLAWSCSSLPVARTPPSINGPRDLFQTIRSHTDSLKDIRSRAKVSIEIDGVRQKATSIVFYRQPNNLRMEVSGTLGVSIMSARFWSDSLLVYLPSDKGYLEGDAARVLYQVTGMNLGYYDVQRIILGVPTLKESDRRYVTSFATTPDQYVLDLHHPLYRRRVWVDRSLVTLAREDIIDYHGSLRSSLRLSGYEQVGDCLLPTKIEIVQGGNHIQWSVESARPNEGLDSDLFVLNIPPGTARLGKTP